MAQKHNEEMISAPMTRYGKMTLESQRQQLRSDAFTAAEWAEHNPILQLGELGSEKDTNKIKIGNGVNAWNDLPYSGGSDGQAIQVEELPEASATEEGKVYQYVGTTGDSLTNGYFYKCTGAGEPVVYSWTQLDVQPAPETLPDQTGQSGKFLTTDGTDASWATINALTNNSSANYSLAVGTNSSAPSTYCTCIGYGATSGNGIVEAVAVGTSSQSFSQGVAVGSGSMSTMQSVSIGKSAKTSMGGGVSSSDFAIAIGFQALADGKGTIQLGKGTNNAANTFKVANTNGNFEIMSADGTIPADRLASTTGLADGNYRLRLTMASGVPTLTWVAE